MTKHAPLPCLVTYKCGIRARVDGSPDVVSETAQRKTENELAEADDNLSLHLIVETAVATFPIKHFLYQALSRLETWGRPVTEPSSKGGLELGDRGEKRLKQTWMISAVI